MKETNWKVPVYIFLFGLLTLYAAIFTSRPKQEFSQEEVLGTATNLNLFIEPEDGEAPLINILDQSKEEVLIEVYLLSDQGVISALKDLEARGVTVKVILEQHPFGGGGLNPKTKDDLEKAGAEVRWGNPTFSFTHQKSLVVDGETACILNLNITKTAFNKNREYNICTTNPDEVSEIRNIFLADWEKKAYDPEASNLLVSPTNARGKLKALITGAKETIDLEVEILVDEEIIKLLASKAREIPVRVILPDFKRVESNKEGAEELRQEGALVRTLTNPYVHAKLILVDRERAYVGSVNLSANSMDLNRELGIIASQSDIIDRLNNTFEIDWLEAKEIN